MAFVISLMKARLVGWHIPCEYMGAYGTDLVQTGANAEKLVREPCPSRGSCQLYRVM